MMQGVASFMGRTATASLHRAASANAASKSFVFGTADNSNSMQHATGAENSRDVPTAQPGKQSHCSEFSACMSFSECC